MQQNLKDQPPCIDRGGTRAVTGGNLAMRKSIAEIESGFLAEKTRKASTEKDRNI
jgi:hypothetical protein